MKTECHRIWDVLSILEHSGTSETNLFKERNIAINTFETVSLLQIYRFIGL